MEDKIIIARYGDKYGVMQIIKEIELDQFTKIILSKCCNNTD